MIAAAIRQLCALSILCGVAMSITPEGSVKRIMSIVCSVVLISAAVEPITRIDFDVYSLELAKYSERESQLISRSEDMNDRLNRLVIEAEYESYILDKANKLSISEISADVTAYWSVEGFWVPETVEIICRCDEQQQRLLADTIEAELGIPAERQQWRCNE